MTRARSFLAARWRWLLLALALLLLLDVLGRSLLSWRQASTAYDDLREVQAVVQPVASFEGDSWPSRQDYAAAVPAAERAAERLKSARDRLWFRGILVGTVGRLPGPGAEVRDGVALMEGATTLAESAALLLGAAEPLFESGAPLIPTLRVVLVERADEINAAFDRIEVARTQLDVLEPDRWKVFLDGYRADFEDAVALIDDSIEARPTFDSAAAQFDRLFGYEGPVTYVLAGQNDQEIRPTGGFIGSIGILTLEDGDIVERNYSSSVEFDPAEWPTREIPFALTYYLGIGGWFVRDANWSPDFPTSARTILEILAEDADVSADGVIAVDSRFVGAMIGIFEPLTVPGFNEPITEANWFALAEAAITGEVGNASAADGTATGWRTSGTNALEAVDLATKGIGTEGLPEGVTTGIRGTYGDIDQLAVYAFQLQPHEEYRGSFYLWVPEDWDGGPPAVDFSEFEGVPGEFVYADPSLYGQWQRVETAITPAEDAQGNLRVYLPEPPSPGSEMLITYAAAVATNPAVAEADAGALQASKQAYLQPVLDTVTGYLQAAGVERLGALAQAVRSSAAGRHIQFFHTDEGVQALADDIGLTGTLQAEPGIETIAVVDANLSYSKMQPAIDRDVTVLIGERGFRDVVITWRNFLPDLGEIRSGRLGKGGTLFDYRTLTYAPADGAYGTYVRVLVPEGSTLVSVNGLDSQPGLYVEGSLSGLGGWVIVPPGEQRTARFTYQLPEGAAVDPMLRLWKQGGLEGYGLRILQNVDGAQLTLFEGEATIDVTVPLAEATGEAPQPVR